MAHFHHFSICTQNQSISNLVIFEQNTKAIALLFGHKWLIFITFQSAIKFNQFQIWSFWAKYQGYSLTFWPKWLIFITFQSAIKINQFQIWSFLGKLYSLTFWLSICNHIQSISNLVIFGQNQGYSLTFWPEHGSFSSLFNLQSKSINFKFGHLWAKYQGYSLTFWP